MCRSTTSPASSGSTSGHRSRSDGLGRVHAAWTDLRAREPDTNIFYARSDNGGRPSRRTASSTTRRRGFDPDRDTPTNQWHPSISWAGNTLFAAWQDNRLGNNDVFFTTSPDGGATFAPSERVDDTGAGHSEQSRPHMAWAEGRCHVVWEDNRSGNADVAAAHRPCLLPARGKK